MSEVFACSKPDPVLICDKDTYKKLPLFIQNERTIRTDINEWKSYSTETTELSETNKKNIAFALEIAHILRVLKRLIIDALKNLEIPDRRQKYTNIFGFEGIDDSYNISYTTAIAGIKEAKRRAELSNKKLLVITAGIAELSKQNQDKNALLGKQISHYADFAMILDSDFSAEISKELKNKEKYQLYPNLKLALDELKANFDFNEWFVLLQPELGDLYYKF